MAATKVGKSAHRMADWKAAHSAGQMAAPSAERRAVLSAAYLVDKKAD
jgi:hypothetical protein